MIAASTFYRRLFQVAAVYNLAFLAWAVLAPGQFFALIHLEGADPFHPLWQCVGMVVGIYGILYWHAAQHLDRAVPIIAVGLLGKVLGPVGWAWNFVHGRIAAAGFLVIVANDLVWWPGFAGYLLRGRSERARYRLLVVVLLTAHAVGAGLLALANWPGTIGAGEPTRLVCWTLAWVCWCIADVFSPPFVRATLRRFAPTASPALDHWLRVLILAAALGDLLLNAVYAALVRPAAGMALDPTLRLLSLTITNGLFLVTYLVLSLALWRAGRLPRWITLLGLPAWTGAFGLCLNGLGMLPGSEP
ncbi:MAG TPA: hypothetical protein VK348_05840, partial [Planctomycetota bacterium]|nr:hypothetical protein [Planctomycetota bacterium]